MAPPWELTMVEWTVDMANAGLISQEDTYTGCLPTPPSPMTGTEFKDNFLKKPVGERKAYVLQLLKEGYIPDFLRDPVKVTKIVDGHTVTYYAMPDMLAIGTDGDYVPIPLSADMVQAIALEYNMVPPTARMVEQIRGDAVQVPFRMEPLQDNPNTPQFDGITLSMYRSDADAQAYFQHCKNAQQDFSTAFWKDVTGSTDPSLPLIQHSDDAAAGGAAVGSMKEFVITNSLTQAADQSVWKKDSTPDKIGMYHPDVQHDRGSGMGVPLDHDQYYSDYSQGLRLVSPVVEVDGKLMGIGDVLSDPDLNTVLSGEGQMDPKHPYLVHAERDHL